MSTNREHVDSPEGSLDARTKRVDELIAMGLNRDQALAVVLGRRELNYYLERLAAKAKKRTLERQYGLAPSVAMQVALGQADLEQVLLRNRRAAHLAEHRELSVFMAGERQLVFGVHGSGWHKGRVRQMSAYEVEIELVGGDRLTVQKRDVKLVLDAADERQFRRLVKRNSELSAAPRPPVLRPQDRLKISDRRWFDWLDRTVSVRATTLEGDVLEGRVEAIARYEIGLVMKRDVRVTLLRHALAAVEPLS